MLGAANAGDNEGHFYWIDREADDTDHLRGYDTVFGTLYEVASGIGAASAGAGAYYSEGGNSGVYCAVEETRDGEIIGRFLAAEDPLWTDIIYAADEPSSFLNHHLPLVFADDSLLVISKQPVPTAMVARAPYAGHEFETELVGFDNW
ncbi:hypothetical protein IIA79_02375, partial [bacterium]|nr:hypothetical protein [bacterium]